MKTHRCKELLEKNKISEKGLITRIRYGHNYGDIQGWWLEYLDSFCLENSYMSTICLIQYCPYCGMKLGGAD